MARFTLHRGVLAILVVGCAILSGIQLAESGGVGEIAWSGECKPDYVVGDRLMVKCGENEPLSVGKTLMAAYAGTAITGEQPETFTCDILVGPIFGRRHLDCATFIDESGSSEEL